MDLKALRKLVEDTAHLPGSTPILKPISESGRMRTPIRQSEVKQVVKSKRNNVFIDFENDPTNVGFASVDEMLAAGNRIETVVILK